MKNCIRSTLLRLLRSKDIRLALLLLVLAFTGSVALRLGQWQVHDMPWGVWFMEGSCGFSAFWPLLLPVAAVLSGPTALCRDLGNGYGDSMLARCGCRRFILARCIAHGMASAAVVLLAGMVCMLLCIPLGWGSWANPERFPLQYARLFAASPMLYGILIIGNDMLLAACFSLMATAIACAVSHVGAVLLLPFAITMLLSAACTQLGIQGWNPMVIASPETYRQPVLSNYLSLLLYGSVAAAACRTHIGKRVFL